MSNQDPFSPLRQFVRVVELGSIRSVARELGIEPSSVSRSLTNLEDRLSAKLLERAQGKTRPTEAGRAYYAKLRQLLGQLEGLETEVRGEHDVPTGLLKVNASIDFGQQHVANWLLDFKRMHPKVDVELTLSARRIDIVGQGIDLAIRIGEQPDSSLKTRKLADNRRVIVASPAYLERRGALTHPKDISDHDYIFFLPQNRERPLSLIGPDGQIHKVQTSGGITIDAIMAIVEAVKRGHGLHTGPRWAFHSALETGDVVEVLSDYSIAPMPIYATWAAAVYEPARIRAFIEYANKKAKLIPGL